VPERGSHVAEWARLTGDRVPEPDEDDEEAFECR